MVSLDDVGAYQPAGRALPKSQAHLYSYINRATSPNNLEPNLSLNLEIADLVNSKKGNMPRDAAVALVHKINSLNPVTSLLAIALLDMLVKNCGYPFHLQIATKEFLNELVRRFPERPPPRPSRVQFRILELLEQWKQTLCETSRYKDDMGYIRDMHRLLHYKGYDFPQINESVADVLNPNNGLKSASEMEEEDRVAHSAKLQELIRRGTPADLAEANRLMKVMAGFDQHKIDYRAKAAAEVDQIRRKAALLAEMLGGLSDSDTVTDGDIYQELADSIRNAQPKLRKMCEDESDDQDAVQRLFELNDAINSIVLKYDLIKKGQFAEASTLPTTIPDAPAADVDGSIGATGGATNTQSKFAQDINLLDFDAEATAAPVPAQVNTPSTSTQSATTHATAATRAPAQKTSDMDDLLGLNFGGLDTFGSSGSISLGGLAGGGHSSAAQPSQGMSAAFSGLSIGGTPSAPSVGSSGQSAARLTLVQSQALSIQLSKDGGRATASDPLRLTAFFTNNTGTPLSNVELQIAVPKSQQISLQNPSSKNLGPNAREGIRQSMTLASTGNAAVTQAKLRFKVSYSSAGTPQEQTGQIQFDL